MSIIHCIKCGTNIDTDYNTDHTESEDGYCEWEGDDTTKDVKQYKTSIDELFKYINTHGHRDTRQRMQANLSGVVSNKPTNIWGKEMSDNEMYLKVIQDPNFKIFGFTAKDLLAIKYFLGKNNLTVEELKDIKL